MEEEEKEEKKEKQGLATIYFMDPLSVQYNYYTNPISAVTFFKLFFFSSSLALEQNN